MGKCTILGQKTVKKCIIMHVDGSFMEKVHYSAVFGLGLENAGISDLWESDDMFSRSW